MKDESKSQILDPHHHIQERICLHNPEFGTTFFKNKTNPQNTKMHHIRREMHHETVNVTGELRYSKHIAKDSLRLPSFLSDITSIKKE